MRPDGWVHVRALSLPKAGHRPDENEDAWAGPVTTASGALRVAVADGATESAFAGAWARALAQAWVGSGSLDAALAAARPAAAREIARRTAGAPWYIAAKAEEGAFAAVLGLELGPDGTWHAEAAGDCALFHLRERELVRAWPTDDPAWFGSRPHLLASRADVAPPPVERAEGTWVQGDRFLLATDALAAFLLGGAPAALGLTDREPSLLTVWERDAIEEAGFESLVRHGRGLRPGSGLRNDDVTLVAVRLAE